MIFDHIGKGLTLLFDQKLDLLKMCDFRSLFGKGLTLLFDQKLDPSKMGDFRPNWQGVNLTF